MVVGADATEARGAGCGETPRPALRAYLSPAHCADREYVLSDPKSTVSDDSAFARAVNHLEVRGMEEEVSELRRLLVERIRFREEAKAAAAEVTQLRGEAERSERQVKEARRVARQCLQNWQTLARIAERREQLSQIKQTLQNYPWLAAAVVSMFV